MDFNYGNPSARFTVPDKLTIRKQLRYASAVAGSERDELVERYFDGAKLLVEDWTCEKYPKLFEINLDEATDPEIGDLIIWVSMAVRTHVANLESLPKN